LIISYRIISFPLTRYDLAHTVEGLRFGPVARTAFKALARSFLPDTAVTIEADGGRVLFVSAFLCGFSLLCMLSQKCGSSPKKLQMKLS
jgi:hypothetical protein